MHYLRKLGYAALGVAITGHLMSAPALASDQDTLESSSLGTTLESAAPEVLDDNYEHLQVSSTSVTADTGDVKTEIPLGPDNPLRTEGYDGLSASIKLPFAEQTAEAEVLADGTPVFDHRNGARTVPVVKSDGSIQITTFIKDASAPTRYSYEVSAPSLAAVEEIKGGTLVFYDEERNYLGGIAPAWAKDADGVSLPTHFEIDGTTVTQVVDHVSSDNVSYPVVADPWLGIDLFSKTSYTTLNGQLRVNATKSLYGQGIHGPGTGQVIFLTAGWNELKAKRPRVTEKTTLRQQYECHVAGGFFNIAGDWNLEKFRPNRTTHWTYGVAVHRCNWTTPNRY